jgi:hypothetical protein
MASPGIGPNGPHLTEEEQAQTAAADSGTTNPAQQFAESIGPNGPHRATQDIAADEDIGPNGPHLTGE